MHIREIEFGIPAREFGGWEILIRRLSNDPVGLDLPLSVRKVGPPHIDEDVLVGECHPELVWIDRTSDREDLTGQVG